MPDPDNNTPAAAIDPVAGAPSAALPDPTPVVAGVEVSPAVTGDQLPPVESGAPTIAPEEAAPPAEADPAATLLEQFDLENKPKPDAAAKPETKPAEAEPKPVDAAPAPAPEAPVEYKFEMPEVLKDLPLDNPQIAAFTETMRGAGVAPEVAQNLLNMHAQALTEFMTQQTAASDAAQRTAWNSTQDEWKNAAIADPEIGGSGHRTAMQAIARVRDMLVPAEQRADFDHFLRATGAGNHPAFLRMLNRAARYMDEPQAGEQPSNFRPPATNGRKPGDTRSVLYDHPSSQKRT